ncbi:cupin domain-containing protein [Aquabacterium sp.]|uniref:cupin domain-containing protein n=1 Tax=Aquabacterium sp. TaxID=1872578 RepID=UPI003783C68F
MGVIDSRVVNLADLTLEHAVRGERYEYRNARIGPLLGARDLGYSYDVVPPGKRSCPFHSHRAEEEMFFIVSGRGLLRYGSETRAVKAGDVICCPTGGPETAHQLINDSDADLAYLSISTQSKVEVCEYPDSDKVAAFAEGVDHITRRTAALAYWDGEPGGPGPNAGAEPS